MANLIHKLIKNKSSSLRMIASFKNLQPPNPTSAVTSPLQTHLNIANQLSLFKSAITDDPVPSLNVFYPSFPFGHCLNPVLSTGFWESEALETDDATHARIVWADSVKKKRKKKMNKHKYKKLRKRLRRKSRA